MLVEDGVGVIVEIVLKGVLVRPLMPNSTLLILLPNLLDAALAGSKAYEMPATKRWQRVAVGALLAGQLLQWP